MKSLQLKVKQKRKFKVTTDSNHKLPVATNVIESRVFTVGAESGLGIGHHVSLDSQQGWIYLAVIIDLYSRRVVGWSIDRRMKKALDDPGFDDGGQFEKATAGPDPPLRQRQPVRQS